MARVRATYNSGAVIRITGDLADGAAYRGAQKIRGRVLSNIRSLGRIDTGAMIQGMQVRRAADWTQLRPRYQLSSTAPYTIFQEAGTRAHGPVRAQRLRFKPKGSDRFVYAKWVRGVVAGRFMQRAFDATTAADFT